MYRGHTVRYYTRASHGLIDVKVREQIICHPRFKWEIKVVRIQLNINSQTERPKNATSKRRKASPENRARELERTPK